MNVRGGGSLHSFGFTTDKEIERLSTVQNYSKKRSGVPIGEIEQGGKSKKRAVISLLLLVLAVFALFAGLYFLLR